MVPLLLAHASGLEAESAHVREHFRTTEERNKRTNVDSELDLLLFGLNFCLPVFASTAA
jgi:hypothetical protein